MSEGIDAGMRFSTSLIEIPFTVDDKEYNLREASADEAAQWRNWIVKCTTLGPEGKPVRMSGIADSDPLLVHLCCRSVENGQRVPLQQIRRKWGNRTVKALAEKIKEISDLEEGPTERELLHRALSQPESPISLDQLRDWVSGLPEDEYQDLAKWLKPLPEEQAKNEQEP